MSEQIPPDNSQKPGGELTVPDYGPREGDPLAIFEPGEIQRRGDLVPVDDHTKAMISRCMGPGDIDLDAVANSRVHVKHWNAHVAYVPIGDDGRVEIRPVTTLLLADGRTAQTVSIHSARYWGVVLAMVGKEWPKDGITVEVGKEPGKVQGHWYPIYYVGVGDLVNPKPKK